MPAIFPPVEINGEKYIDGGIVDNVPFQRAIDAGATRIVILLCSPPVMVPPPSRRPVEGMVNALLIAIHARFVRDMAHLPEGVEVILCAGPEGATRDFDDFSTTEHLIALGRAEASEIVRRYALGTVPYPAPPLPTPHSTDEATGNSDDGPGSGPSAGPRPVPDQTRHSGGPDQSLPLLPSEVRSDSGAAAEPVTQPDPGT